MFMWLRFDKWVFKRNLESFCDILLVTKSLNVWHLAHQGCTRFTAPLMVLHPFRHYQLFKLAVIISSSFYAADAQKDLTGKVHRVDDFSPGKDRLSVTL